MKEIPAHIEVRLVDGQYSMYNMRLEQYVKEEYAEYPRAFRTEEAATNWYRSLI